MELFLFIECFVKLQVSEEKPRKILEDTLVSRPPRKKPSWFLLKDLSPSILLQTSTLICLGPLSRNTEVKVFPGETALAFYRAENKSDEDILGIATYNVQPPKAGIYFNKIQCFCFEEQRLKAKEVVEMPVFFFIDPEFAKDSRMNDVTDISLSYTFFPSEDVSDEMLQRMGWYRDENNQLINKESPAVYPVSTSSS
jgi:hypothetical protein